jgi:hypothetical protein
MDATKSAAGKEGEKAKKSKKEKDEDKKKAKDQAKKKKDKKTKKDSDSDSDGSGSDEDEGRLEIEGKKLENLLEIPNEKVCVSAVLRGGQLDVTVINPCCISCVT